LAVLGAVLVAGIAAAIWFAMSTGTGDAPETEKRSDAPASSETSPKSATPAAPRAKRVGTAAVFGEIRRSASKAPVPDQLVTLSPERGDPWTATTDAQGAFRFDKIPHGGPYLLSAAAPGCATIRIPGIALDRNEQRNLGTLFLDPSVKLTVRVRGGADEPLEGALVEAFAVPQMIDWDWSKAIAQMAQAPIAVGRATTDAAGEASFPEMAVGTWTFSAKKEGFAPGGAKRVTLRSDVEPRPVSIWLAPGHPLDGHVLGSDKKPVADAVVTASGPGSMWDYAASALRARTTTDAEGRYAFAALESGDAQISVGRPGGIPAVVATVRVPLVPHLEITLPGDGSIAGVVTEKETGKPAEGATVRASSWESGSSRVAEAVTDADGKYSIRLTAGAVNRLTVEKPGFVQVRDEAAPQGQQRVGTLHDGETLAKDLVIRRGARLTGTVKTDEGPTVGARVSMMYGRPNEGYQQKSATTDSAGRYEFTAVDKGVVLVTATKEGAYLPDAPDNTWQAMQSPDVAKDLKVEIPESGDVVKDLVMKRGSGIEGTVAGPDGAPLAGVRVSAAGAMEAPPTGADGAFRLVGAKPGPSVRLFCAKDGYVNAANKPVVVVADQPTTGVALKMYKEPRVKGTVTTASGAPPTEARVLLAYKAAGSQDNPWEETNRWQNATRVAVRPDGTFDGPVTTAAAGGKLLVRAVSLDQQQTDAKPIDLVEGQDLYETTIVLTDGVEMTGTVVAKGGSTGVAGARVSVVQKRASDNNMMYGSNGQIPVWAVTDAAGAFRVPHLVAAQFDVRAEAEGFVVGRTTVNLADGKPVVVEMSPEMTIEGVVAYADGVPLEGVTVQVLVGGQGIRTFGSMQESQPSATTDSNGAFRLSGVGEGTYTLDVRPQWGSDLNFRPLRVDGVAAGARGVKVVAERGGSITGRVADPQGHPIPAAYISAGPVQKPGVAMTGNEWRNAQTKSDGTFTLTGLAEGPYNLQVMLMNGAGGGGYRPVNVPNVAVGTKDLAVVLEPGLSISGVVNDADGRPISQMAIQATPTNGSGGGNAYTDYDGKFTISGLAAGAYRLEVAQWGGSNQAYVLDAQSTYAAGTANLRLVAGKGVTITGTLVDESGNPVGGGFVNAAAKGVNNRYAQGKGDGTFEIVGVAAGQSYELSAQVQGRVNARVPDVLAGSKDVRIVLAKGMEATGKLSDASGKPMASASISFSRTGGGQNQWVQTGADGRFTVGGLADGVYDAKLYVQGADGKGGEWKTVGQIKGGDRDVDLRMPQ
jgi:5-hydroxyisourate hydrolase-like protein (transthyretin family)